MLCNIRSAAILHLLSGEVIGPGGSKYCILMDLINDAEDRKREI